MFRLKLQVVTVRPRLCRYRGAVNHEVAMTGDVSVGNTAVDFRPPITLCERKQKPVTN